MSESARIWDCTDAEYFADTEHQASHQMKMFRGDPTSYRERYIDACVAEEPGRLSTKGALEFGTVFHTMVLEPDKVSDVCDIEPDASKKSNAGKEEWLEFEEELDGRIAVRQADFEALRGMKESLMKHEEAYELLFGRSADRLVEKVAVATEPVSGVSIKCMFDVLWTDGVLVDLKTSRSADPFEFMRDALKFGYDYQGGHYSLVAEQLLDCWPVEFSWVVCQKPKPYHVAVHTLDPADWMLVKRDVVRWLFRFSECRDMNDWSPTWARGRNVMSLPAWRRKIGE